MGKKEAVVVSAGALYALSSFLPLSKATPWWLRVLDFPRLQFLLAGIVGLGFLLRERAISPRIKIPLAAAMTVGLALDAYRVLPYSRLYPREVRNAPRGVVRGSSRGLRVFVANVYQHNRRYDRLLEAIRDTLPDVLLLLEVDDAWFRALSSLEAKFPFGIARPLANEYGMAFFSRFPLRDERIDFLLEDDIPSLFTRVILDDGSTVALYGVHPRPPRPKAGDSAGRDAELVLVGERAARHEEPVIVMGDLNDVAWSHTSRLFRRISGLLDPRVGRGPFTTFPQAVPLMRFPLDYVFHSPHFFLGALIRRGGYGSDHFAVVAELVLDPKAAREQEAPKAQASDAKEAREVVGNGMETAGARQ